MYIFRVQQLTSFFCTPEASYAFDSSSVRSLDIYYSVSKRYSILGRTSQKFQSFKHWCRMWLDRLCVMIGYNLFHRYIKVFYNIFYIWSW